MSTPHCLFLNGLGNVRRNLHSLGAVRVVSPDAETSRKFIRDAPSRQGLLNTVFRGAGTSPNLLGSPKDPTLMPSQGGFHPDRILTVTVSSHPECCTLQPSAWLARNFYVGADSPQMVLGPGIPPDNIFFHKVDHTSSIKRHSAQGSETVLGVLLGSACFF